MLTSSKKIARRIPVDGDEKTALVRYFASAGAQFTNMPRGVVWLPHSSGRLLRHFWREARSGVRKLVPPRAFELMEREFSPGQPSRNFDNWPTETRREIFDLCEPTGCVFWIDEHGNALPRNWTMENCQQKAREHLAKVRDDG